ncbi:protein mono-ADP-ribosyltransferase PARP3-like [Corticium candelabrum]|uniref:protein mono-ADP-ribosyltransferase PARP3-like n=1 Tax=Corticium candelabrum TaxID=121492 RepID=UPI002E26914B|nr:protein mono-ADP-ribosyltransferase PARP3-like [Corticium candelabrum]
MPSRKRTKKADEDSSAAATDVDASKMTVAGLKAELAKRGLETSGKKADLVKRLKDAMGDDETDAAEEPSAKKSKPEKKKVEEKDQRSEASKKMAQLKETKKKRTAKIDQHCYLASRAQAAVVDDYDCMLNQTNIGHNNNKYYVIQLINCLGSYYVWNRWGRVGESGQNAMKEAFGDLNKAVKEFEKKFKDKTKNDWSARHKFTPAPGKYTLIEMDDEDEDDGGTAAKLAALDDKTDAPKKVRSCTLDKHTQSLIKLIFDHDMFKEAMEKMELDTKKMPLGKISKSQIAKGFEVLEEMEKELKKKSTSGDRMRELSSRFYTLIPHSFGRQRPPTINSEEGVRQKMDMLLVLADIELAQELESESEKKKVAQGDEVDHPIDINYGLLKCHLKHVDPNSDTFKIIKTYTAATGPTWRSLEIQDVFEVDRESSAERFKPYEGLENHQLLWHGTNVAVVAAILKGGLRIMPHSGGRVGKGIYFASENSKSAGYVRTAANTGIMFLAQVALGKEHSITKDNWSLTAPPSGFDSIVARGRTEPDRTKDTSVKLDGKDVSVPQTKPLQQPPYSTSNFSQSEYLIYKESQCRIRYLLKLKM